MMPFFRSADDVSAVVLSTGESTTHDAIASLQRQSMPVRAVIVVRDVTPFHKAMTFGAAQVETPFFVQVDADMILDPHCVAALRQGIRIDVGIVVGHLRDALVEKVVGVKLFRTACFNVAQFDDTISPDTDFVDAIERAGWKTTYIGRRWRSGPHPWKTFGEHRPNYSPAYTFRKYWLEGQRFRYRQKLDGLRWLLGRLAASRHPAALIAQIALATGFFVTGNRDALDASADAEEFENVEHLFASKMDGPTTTSDISLPRDVSSDERFDVFFRLGNKLSEKRDMPTFAKLMNAFNDVEHCDESLISKIALCKGLSARRDEMSDAAIKANCRAICSLLDRRYAPSDDKQSKLSTELKMNSIATYATTKGLTQFVVDGPCPTEYRTDLLTYPPIWRSTGRNVTRAIDAHGRLRIKAPFTPFGHVICTQVERTTSVYWCLDLLRSGYAFAHLPTPLEPRRILLGWQLCKICLARMGLSSRRASLRTRMQKIAQFRTGKAKPSHRSVRIYRRTEDYSAFAACGLARREVFGHLVLALPKPYPDSQLLLEKNGMPRHVVERGNFQQINVYTTDFFELPDVLFSHPEINWHEQQFGLKGLIASAGLWIKGSVAKITTLQSDLCQQLYRHSQLKNLCKTQVETHFRRWYTILFNAVLDFCATNGVSLVYTPTGEQIAKNMPPKIEPDLFLRIYNDLEKQYLCRRTRQDCADYWEVPVAANRSRIVQLLPSTPVTRKLARPQICIFHDVEENVDTSISAAQCENNLTEMLKIESELGVTATYNVLGTLLRQKRDEILGSNPRHSIAFHSFNHRIDDLNQLRKCREIDLRVKGYRPPRSELTTELTDYSLTFLNFEWLACSADRLGFDVCRLENGLVKIPIALDDYQFFTGNIGYDEWESRLLAMASARSFFAVSLHDCYAGLWLKRYKQLLNKLASVGDFVNADEVLNRMLLGGSTSTSQTM